VETALLALNKNEMMEMGKKIIHLSRNSNDQEGTNVFN
jgi:hypothetical protein